MSNSFSFETVNKPDSIIEDYRATFKSDTRDYVDYSLEKYDGPIFNYEKTTNTGISATISTFDFGARKETVYVQDSLGASDNLTKTYSLKLISPYLSSYSFKVLYLRYAIGGYPATVVLEESISKDVNKVLSSKSGYVYKLNGEEEFKDLLAMIIESKTFHAIVQGIISEAIEAQKQQEDSETSEC